MEKKKIRPGDLRQQMNRVRNSRDNLKNRLSEKLAFLKKGMYPDVEYY